MKVSKKAYYGLRAALRLAQSDHALSIRSLATMEHLPEDYLEKILQSLRRSNIVSAKKGTRGGYSLARSPKGITVWDIVRTLDGPIKTFAPPKRKTQLPCPDLSHCQSNEVWRTLEQSIEKTLSRLSLQDLLPQSHIDRKQYVSSGVFIHKL